MLSQTFETTFLTHTSPHDDLVTLPPCHELVDKTRRICTSSHFGIMPPTLRVAAPHNPVDEIAYAEIFEHDNLSWERQIVLSHGLLTNAPKGMVLWVTAHELAELVIPYDIQGHKRELAVDTLASHMVPFAYGIATFQHIQKVQVSHWTTQLYETFLSTHPTLQQRIDNLLQTAPRYSADWVIPDISHAMY